MNKRFFSATAAIFIVWFIGRCLIHHWLLYDEYAKLSNFFRPDADIEQLVPFSIFAHLALAGAFTWIYVKGLSTDGTVSSLGQGIRYGVVIACSSSRPTR